MRENDKPGYIWTIFIIVILAVIIIGFFVPRNSFSPTESKKKTFGQFTPRTTTPEGAVPGPLKWKKSFAYEKENNSSNKGQSYMQYMMDKNKK